MSLRPRYRGGSWRSVGLALLVLIAGAELFAVELLFRRNFHATLDLSLFDAACLGAFVVIVGGIVCLLPDTKRGVRGAAWLVVLTLGTAHWLLTMFLALSVASLLVEHTPPPLLLIFTQPLLSLSLLASVGILPVTVFIVLTVALALHVAVHAAVGTRTVSLVRQAGRLRLHKGRVPTDRLALLYLAATALFGLWLGNDLVAEPVRQSFRDQFRFAPPGLALATGTQPRPVRAGPPLPHPRPVILIIVDALRPDRTSVYDPVRDTTPFLRSLYRAGTLQRIDRAYGGCSYSMCGILGILTSRTWDDFGAWPQTVMDVLAGHGYRNYLILSGNHSQFGNLTRLYGLNLTALSDDTLNGAGQPDNDLTVLRRLKTTHFTDPASSFVYLHLMSAHAGSYLLPGLGSAGRIGGIAQDSQFETGRSPPRYDLGVRQSDEMIRRIFGMLDRKGMLADALVVITADHGERLGEDGRYLHGAGADERILAVPLLIYDRHAAAYPVRPIASHLDIAPTILTAVGAPVPRTMTGIPLQVATQRVAIPFGTSETTGALVRLDGKTYRIGCERQTGLIDVRQFETPQLDGRVIPNDAASRPLYDRLRTAYRALPRAMPAHLAPC